MNSIDARRSRRILLCATGAFECYALPGFILALLRHCADDVQVVLSRAAAELTSKSVVEVASRNPVFVDTGERHDGIYVPHIELSRRAGLVLVYPASVSILGKVANGIADELISALILAAEVPVIFVPFTNEAMWRHPAVQRNVRLLEQDGYSVMPNPEAIEVATRQGLAASAMPFPLPTLQVRIAAALAGAGRGTVDRSVDAGGTDK
ncbi:MAG: flavoprotein [Acidobacteriota bacterium]